MRQKTEKMDVRLVNIYCQLGRIENHPGDKSLGSSVRKFLYWIPLTGKIHSSLVACSTSRAQTE